MEESQTPLSDLISEHARVRTPESFARFVDSFRKSTVGVIANGLPEGVTKFVSTAEHPISVGQTKHAGGHCMALAFADPVAFARKFGLKFNAGMPGEALLRGILLNPKSEGVLVNSAKDEVSIVIDRKAILSLPGFSG
jgi:hypothetical protein